MTVKNINIENLQKIDTWLSTHFDRENFKGDFSRTRKIFENILLEFRHRDFQVVTIAGTNGKGETALSLELLLAYRGISTALWTSPHILAANERFRFDGEEMEIPNLLESFKIVYDINSDLKQASYYEFLFYVFLYEVLQRNVAVVILEVGLGGRLDATNLLNANLMCITSISRDHENILGMGYKKILMEKLGIARSQRLLITGLELGYLREITRQYTVEKDIPWIDLYDLLQLEKNSSYRFKNRIMAKHLANYMFRKLQVTLVQDEEFSRLEQMNFRARMEEITTVFGKYIFNGAHNIDGIRKFIEELQVSQVQNLYPSLDYTLVSFSQRPNKDIYHMLKILKENSAWLGNLILCYFHHPKAWAMQTMVGEDNNHVSFKDISGKLIGVVEVTYIGNAWEKKITDAFFTNKSVMVVGSYYFVGEVQKTVLKKLIL